jgi:hypothetical protein
MNIEIHQIPKPTTAILKTKAHKQFSKAIGTIVRKSSTTLCDKRREKENKSYDKSPTYYHKNLKISAGMLPRTRDRPRVTALINPKTEAIHTSPKEVINLVTTYYIKKKERATP